MLPPEILSLVTDLVNSFHFCVFDFSYFPFVIVSNIVLVYVCLSFILDYMECGDLCV